jgi:hypothetical protein
VSLVAGIDPTVAALYVDPDGVYANLPGVEVWDEVRDARRYAGPWPVVAHPPCSRWSILGSCRGYRDGADGGCFQSALATVHTFGGVIEHPAHSLAWETFDLPKPKVRGWTSSLTVPGWTTAVDQGRYGLPFHKSTWIYAHLPDPSLLPELDWIDGGRQKLTANNAHNGAYGFRGSTPERFRDVLLAMARSAA